MLLVCPMTSLKGKQYSKRSDRVCDPDNKSFALASLTLVNWSPANAILISCIGLWGVFPYVHLVAWCCMPIWYWRIAILTYFIKQACLYMRMWAVFCLIRIKDGKAHNSWPLPFLWLSILQWASANSLAWSFAQSVTHSFHGLQTFVCISADQCTTRLDEEIDVVEWFGKCET